MARGSWSERGRGLVSASYLQQGEEALGKRHNLVSTSPAEAQPGEHHPAEAARRTAPLSAGTTRGAAPAVKAPWPVAPGRRARSCPTKAAPRALLPLPLLCPVP